MRSAHLAVAVLALVAACSRERPVDRAAPAVPPPVTAPAPAASAPVPSDVSIYDLALALRDSADRPIGLDVDRGHPTLVSMFYGSCPTACPAMFDELARILAELGGTDVRVLMVSFDPARDTPAQLHRLAADHRVDARWTVAVASDADARALAAVLGINYRKLPSGAFTHNSVIVAVDREGRPVARVTGLGRHDAIVAALAAR